MSGPAKRFHAPRALALAGFVFLLGALFGAFSGGCGRDDSPRIQVVNESGMRVSGLWVATAKDSTRVPALGPGERTEVRVRMRGEGALRMSGAVNGRPLSPQEDLYAEGSGGYRFRATIDSSGAVQLRFVRLAIW